MANASSRTKKRTVAHHVLLDPRRRWSEHFGRHVGRAEVWRQLAGLCGIVVLLESAAIAYMGLSPRVEPVTALIDRTGAHAIVGYAERVPNDDPRIIAPILRRFIADVRGGAPETAAFSDAFVPAGSAAEATVRGHRRALAVRGAAAARRTEIEPQAVDPTGAGGWRIGWVERRLDPETRRIETAHYEATVKLGSRPPVGLDPVDERNPLGLYIHEVSWRALDSPRVAQAPPAR